MNASNDADKVGLSIVKLTDTHQPIEVDFNRMIILKPDQYGITRAFDPGVFLQYKSSISQMQLHAKLFRLQVSKCISYFVSLGTQIGDWHQPLNLLNYYIVYY